MIKDVDAKINILLFFAKLPRADVILDFSISLILISSSFEKIY